MNMPEECAQAAGDMAARVIVQVERVRASEILGRSEPLHRLFDYLAARSGSEDSPKEFEIAQEALGKSGSFDVAQDASIRVYIHRLRKKLDEFYAAAPEGGDRLSIPRGSYRLILSAVEPGVDGGDVLPPLSPPFRTARWTRRIGTMIVATVALALATGAGYTWANLATYPTALANSAIWGPIAKSPLRTTVAIGNQPLPGGHPHVTSMGSVVALARVGPALTSLTAHPSNVPPIANVTWMSPSLLRDSNIIFIGTLNQIGVLTDPVFDRSGFYPPDENSVLVDRHSGRRFVSMPPPFVEHRRLDSYGYLASLTGPAGNQMLIISGATDGALVQIAEVATDPAQIKALTARAGPQFEALYVVSTLDSINVGYHLEMVRPITR
jgi:hypothetical protein